MVTTGKITKAQLANKIQMDIATEGIRAQIATAYPGMWAAQANYGPACCCGLRTKWIAEGGGIPTGTCARHPWAHMFVRAEESVDG